MKSVWVRPKYCPYIRLGYLDEDRNCIRIISPQNEEFPKPEYHISLGKETDSGVKATRVARYEFFGPEKLSFWHKILGFTGRVDMHFLRTGEALVGYLR